MYIQTVKRLNQTDISSRWRDMITGTSPTLFDRMQTARSFDTFQKAENILGPHRLNRNLLETQNLFRDNKLTEKH